MKSSPALSRPNTMIAEATPVHKGTAVISLASDYLGTVFGPREISAIAERTRLLSAPLPVEQLLKRPDLLQETEYFFTGWGAPVFDEDLLARMPRLRAVFYAAGSVKHLVTEHFWARGIVLTTANEMLAIPVAEYCVAQILFCLKKGWQHAEDVRSHRGFPPRRPVQGNYDATIALLSFGTTGRMVRERLLTYEHRVIVYDPYLSAEEAALHEVERVSLPQAFANADIVSCHCPLLPATTGLIGAEHFRAMRPGATFINTARGPIVREAELVQVLRERPDLYAVLDVTDPEPPLADSPLFDVSNVLITPHIAGPMGRECLRMGRMMCDDLARLLAGQPLVGHLDRDDLAIRA